MLVLVLVVRGLCRWMGLDIYLGCAMAFLREGEMWGDADDVGIVRGVCSYCKALGTYSVKLGTYYCCIYCQILLTISLGSERVENGRYLTWPPFIVDCQSLCYLGNRFTNTSRKSSVSQNTRLQISIRSAHLPLLEAHSWTLALLGLHFLLCFPLFRRLGLVRHNFISPGVTVDLLLHALRLLR